jgi:hypothetical protein
MSSRSKTKVGLPDDGIAGPEVWEHLFPFWIVNIIVLGSSSNGTARPQNPNPNLGQATQPEPPSSPASDRKFIGSPFAKATMDNIAEQLGIQKDKDGLTAIFVKQATWKTEEDPKEIVPGHWEYTGGLQLNTPIGRPGQNLQANYQLTRAEILSVDLAEGLGLTGDLWVQPTVQAPLDSGNSRQTQPGSSGSNRRGDGVTRNQGRKRQAHREGFFRVRAWRPSTVRVRPIRVPRSWLGFLWSLMRTRFCQALASEGPHRKSRDSK